MPGTPVNLGPFKGGWNNVSGLATIGDDQLSIVDNFEMDLDGSLVSRPAIVVDAATPVAGQPIDGLGYYVRADGVTFLVATTTALTWIYDLTAKTWTQIWANKASSFAQYDNKIVLMSATIAGGYWEAGTFTATASMPAGSQIVFYQERFWAFGVRGTVNASTVWFSNINAPGTPATIIWDWVPGTNFFTVQKGDGEWITGLLPDATALVIFRNASTYQFTYPSSPFQGTLREINSSIGADNQWCFGPYESHYLVLSQGFLYQFVNHQYYPLNTKRVDFKAVTLTGGLRYDLRLSIYGRRAIVWYQGGTYVYNITTTTWSRWDSPTTRGAHFLTVPPTSIGGDRRVAYVLTGEADSAKYGLYRVEDGVLATGGGESFTCQIRTKAYNLHLYQRNYTPPTNAKHKRLFYWTAEVASSSGATGIAHPLALSGSPTTWNQMNATTWNEIAKGSWNNPLVILFSFTDTAVFPAAAPQMSLVKFGQDMRFIRIYFDVFLACDGTARTAPARIYSITPHIKAHGGVAEKVS